MSRVSKCIIQKDIIYLGLSDLLNTDLIQRHFNSVVYVRVSFNSYSVINVQVVNNFVRTFVSTQYS